MLILQVPAVNARIARRQAAGVPVKIALQHTDGVLKRVQVVFMIIELAGVAQILAALGIFPAEDIKPESGCCINIVFTWR